MSVFVIIFIIICLVAGMMSRTKSQVLLEDERPSRPQRKNNTKDFNHSDDFLSSNDHMYMGMGTRDDSPILMNSKNSTEEYLQKLTDLRSGLSYRKIGSINKSGYRGEIDEYGFSLNGRQKFSIFIYSYSDSCLPIIPMWFEHLDTFN
ncbi:MAG: hypothetical protein Q8O62_08935 [Aequorivita sp.]|nr:hypothetical protein [Aequorivita sp.]